MRPALPPTRPRTPARPSAGRRLATALGVGLVGLAVVAAGQAVGTGGRPASASLSASGVAAAPAKVREAPGGPTPGDFRGYGFDQCLAPTQAAMDRWLVSSPYLAVGIYISGDSRACRDQPNLTPTWVATQLRNGWELLPITLGPQASCQPRFPRYRDDFTISPVRGAQGRYPKARLMGRESGAESVADARALGIPSGSTLWYDLEGFDHTNTACRESALAFVSAWVTTVKAQGFVTGVYSSAGSGIKALDDVRRNRPTAYTLPDQIWLARWDGLANTNTSYIANDGWRPGRRVKQYRGGHDETWGGVRINIDSNYLDLGRGMVAPRETHCGGTTVDFLEYGALAPPRPGYQPDEVRVAALKCLLKEQEYFAGAVNGVYGKGIRAVVRRWKAERKLPVNDNWIRTNWIALLSAGSRPILKDGSAGVYGTWVRRAQRALNAADVGVQVNVDGTFDATVTDAVRRYQRRVGLTASGVVDGPTWTKLQTGSR